MTKEQREMSSYIASEKMVSRTDTFGRRKNSFYRSSPEEVFAKSLKNLDIEFLYEPFNFKLRNENDIFVHYIPDFHILNSNLFIEVTGNLTRPRKHKILLFQEQYPKLKLMVITNMEVKRWCRGEFDIAFDEHINKEAWSINNVEKYLSERKG